MFGLAGQTNLEKAQADEIVDAINDLFNARVAAVRETDEVKKTELTKTLMSETIPNTLVRNLHNCFNVLSMIFKLFLIFRRGWRPVLSSEGGSFLLETI